MSQYTTGELAKACGVTVRTVQYYDTRGILIPSALSEGGRRLYSDEDLRKMKIICFLREIGLSLDTIGQLLKEEDPGSVISVLLEQQEQALREEMSERQEKLNRLDDLKKALRGVSEFSIETIDDIATVMESKKKLRRLRRNIIAPGIGLNILEWASILLWAFKGIWQPFALWIALTIPFIAWAVRYYYRNTAYICPQCHEVFRPTFKESFFAKHTWTTRKLTCVKCGHHGFCVEIWGGDIQ